MCPDRYQIDSHDLGSSVYDAFSEISTAFDDSVCLATR